MNPYQLLGRVDALRARLADLRGRSLLDDDTSRQIEHIQRGEMPTRRLLRELRLAVANVFDVPAHSMAETVERRERDTAR